MESLNLNTLASSLQASSTLQTAEQELLNNFKAAALSITTLYRSSRHTSERAYNAGYASACQDLLMMIQQGVSDGQDTGNGMAIGRVMDWIEARLEAIKSREEEQEEDEEREKSKVGTAKPKLPVVTASQASPATPPVVLPAPSTTLSTSNTAITKPKQTPTIPPSQPFAFTAPPPPDVPTVSAGAKRRHAVMMMLDSTTAQGESSTRRRTRSSTSMDIEEDGRERKRPARR